jgi:hypothetical protein
MEVYALGKRRRALRDVGLARDSAFVVGGDRQAILPGAWLTLQGACTQASFSIGVRST